MKIAIYCVAGTGLTILLLVWVMTQIHYRIGSKHLKVVLFGAPIRRIPLETIVRVSKRAPKGMAERWHNTVKSSHRLVTLEVNRGLRKHICITPRNRYVFVADLKAAVRRVNPESEFGQLGMEEGTTTMTRKEAEEQT